MCGAWRGFASGRRTRTGSERAAPAVRADTRQRDAGSPTEILNLITRGRHLGLTTFFVTNSPGVEGFISADQVEVRIRITLRRALAEAVFAKGVVIVEGYTDAGFLQGLADRRGGLDAAGIAIVNGHGKQQLLIPWAILTELGIPTYVVFDGDVQVAKRMRSEGKSEEKAEAAERKAHADNKLVLAALGAEPQETPATTVAAVYSVFHDTIESEWAAWEGFQQRVETVIGELGDFRAKSEDAYRRAASDMPTDPPHRFSDLVVAILAITR